MKLNWRWLKSLCQVLVVHDGLRAVVFVSEVWGVLEVGLLDSGGVAVVNWLVGGEQGRIVHLHPR